MVNFGRKSGIKCLKNLGFIKCMMPAKQKKAPNIILKTRVVSSIYLGL
jgi:hypothetical protein